MVVAGGLLLLVGVFVVVAWPFFRRNVAELGPGPGTLSRWERQKVEAYGAIKDAELDLQTGKLSEADFDFIRDKYAARALEAIAAMEQASERTARSRHTAAVRFLFCPECGGKLPARARFCPACGRALRSEDAA